MSLSKREARKRRHRKIVKKLQGTNKRPRLVVYRSNVFTYAQLIDDDSGKTLASASDMKGKKGKKMEQAKKVGLDLAKKAAEKKITDCVFDRNGLKYHGRVKAVAEGAREGGLKF